MSKKWQVVAHHKNWVEGATITESFNVDNPRERRFTASIRGFRNWKIRQGENLPDSAATVADVVKRVKTIRDRIDNGDETIYHEPNEYEMVTA